MKTTTKLICAVSFWALLSLSGKGQDAQVTVGENVEAPANVDIREIQQAIQEAITEYEKYATLADDEEGGELTARFEKGFYSLFTDAGLSDVLQDFYVETRPDDVGTPEDYVSFFRRTGMRGLAFIMNGPVITSIAEDSNSDDIFVDLKVNKKFSELYNRQAQSKEYAGDIRELLFYYNVFVEDGKYKAVLSSIKNDGKIVRKENPQRYLSIYGGVGFNSLSPVYNSYWNSTHEQSGLNIQGGVSFSFGGEFMTNQFYVSQTTGKRRIAPLAGLRLSYHQFQTDIADVQLSDFDAVATSGGNSSEYQRHVLVNEATEEITLWTVDVPVGAGVRLNRSENLTRHNFYLNVRAIPTFGLSAQSSVSANGNYDGTLYLEDGNLSEFRILNQNAVRGDVGDDSNWRSYNVGSGESINAESDPALSAMGLKLELSPTMYIESSENRNAIEFMVGLDIGYQFLSNFAHDGVNSVDEESFRFNDVYPESAINQYADNLNGLYFGLRVGVYQRKEVVR